jgi:hypothetical protein
MSGDSALVGPVMKRAQNLLGSLLPAPRVSSPPAPSKDRGRLPPTCHTHVQVSKGGFGRAMLCGCCNARPAAWHADQWS